MTSRSAFTGNPKELVVHINSRQAGTWIPERTNDSNKFNPGLWLCVIIAEHLVHMPSHLYIRTGDHESGEKTNVAAMRVDDAYFAVAHPQGIYPLMYYTHNLHFIAAENAFMGNYSASLQAALRAAAPAMAKMALNSTGAHNSEVIPQMMSEVVEARLAQAQHQTDAAIEHSQRAVSLEEHVRIRQTARLAGAHARVARRRAPECRKDHRRGSRFPRGPQAQSAKSPFALCLAETLKAEGKTTGAATVRQQFQRAWSKADTKLISPTSRFLR